MASEEGNPRVIAAATQWIADNIRWVLFLAIPFQAFAARTILFRKSELNFVEHTVPLFYTTGHLFWLSMMMFAYRKVTGELPSVYMTVLSPLYFGYMYSNFISYQSRVKAFVKGMSVYIIGQFLFVLTMVVIVIVVVILLALIAPETLNKFRPIPR